MSSNRMYRATLPEPVSEGKSPSISAPRWNIKLANCLAWGLMLAMLPL